MEQRTKNFRKRNAILSYLMQSKVHPSAEWVYERVKADVPDISLGTVYRNLAMFEKQGMITSVDTVNGVERFDGDLSPHTHFICNSCGKVEDLPGMEIPRELLPKAEQISGGEAKSFRLNFYGICQDCKKK